MNLKTSLQRYGEKQYRANNLIRKLNKLLKILNNYAICDCFYLNISILRRC